MSYTVAIVVISPLMLLFTHTRPQVDPEEMEDIYAEPRLPQNIDVHNTAEPATGDDLADPMIIRKTQ